MNRHRKSNQYYEDQYDRETIKEMKKLRELSNATKKDLFIDRENYRSGKTNLDTLKYRLQYNNLGAERAKDRTSTIEDWIKLHEQRDQAIQSTPIPSQIKCDTCSEPMRFNFHSFTADEKLIFFFQCSYGHFPKKAIYADGSEHYIQINGCSYCGGKLNSRKEQTKTKLTFTDNCERCDKTEITEYDLTPEKILPIIEEERKVYCIDFIGARALREDLAAAKLQTVVTINREEKYVIKHIKQFNVAQVEQLLTEKMQNQAFVKVAFDKPETGRNLTVKFSAQDPTDRSEKLSIKTLRTTIKETLSLLTGG